MSGTLFTQLLEKMEQCSSDGIDCDHCPVLAQCTSWWDAVYLRGVNKYRYSSYATHLDKLRKKKRSLARQGGDKRE